MKITVYILPSAASGSDRVFRGGSWFSAPAFARVADRYWCAPDYRGEILGFRLFMTEIPCPEK